MDNHVEVYEIDHAQQLYDTVGNWKWLDKDKFLNVAVSKTGDWRYFILIAVHEIVEAALCRHAGIKEEAVTAFDVLFEQQKGEGEPGDDPGAPYRRQHLLATGIEQILAAELGVDWKAYGEALAKL